MDTTNASFVRASERIRLKIEAAIREGSLLPGDSIDEAELAADYGVSRTPIREALMQLQAQGLLTNLPRGGTVVAKIDLQQLLSLMELLGELEGVTAKLATQRISSDELTTLLSVHEESARAVEADDFNGWSESNTRFHEVIYTAARNPFLRQEVLRIRTRTGYYRRHAFGALGKIRTSFDQHRQIVEAIQRGNADAAATAMIAHMRPASDAKGLTDFLVAFPKDVLTMP